MREPRWLRGAYAVAPHIQHAAGTPSASASVEAWRGTPAELLSPVSEISKELGGSVRVLLTDDSGRSHEFNDLVEATSWLSQVDADSVLSVRATCDSPSRDITSTLVARPRVPGLTLEVIGRDRGTTLGVAEIAFQRMMIGYVDRMGGWRGLAWVFTAIAPMLLLSSIAISPGQTPWLIRLVVLVVATASSFAVFLLAHRVFLVARGFDLIARLPQPRKERVAVSFRRIRKHKATRAIAGVLGALLIGVIGNKLSDLLPWP